MVGLGNLPATNKKEKTVNQFLLSNFKITKKENLFAEFLSWSPNQRPLLKKSVSLSVFSF